MSQPKTAILIQRLYKRTLEGKVPWEKTVEEDVFQASFPGYSVRILERPTREEGSAPDAMDCVIQIFNEDGTLMEEIDDVELRPGWVFEMNPYRTMDSMYSTARRQAMGVEVALDKLLEELSEE